MKLRNPLGWLSLAVAVVAGAITVHYLLSTDKSPKPGYAEIVADPVSSGQGNVLKVQPGEVGDILNRFSLVIPLPATAVIHSATLPAHPATFYLKVLRPSVKGQPGMVDIVWGLASDSVRGRKMEVSYRDASVIGRYDITGKMYIWDNYQYLPVTREPLDTDTWYELWYVIDHARNTYDLHIKGGSQFPLTTCAARGISYRMNTQEALDRLLIITTAGSRNTVEKGKDPSYFDSFYMYPQGANTSPPDNAWILIEDFENSSHRFEN